MSNDPFKEIGEFEFDFMPDYKASTERARNISVSNYTYHATKADVTVRPNAQYARNGGCVLTLVGEDGVVVHAIFDAIGNLTEERIRWGEEVAVW